MKRELNKSPKMANYIQEVYDMNGYQSNVVSKRHRATEVKIKEPDQIMTDKMIDEHLERHLHTAVSPGLSPNGPTQKFVDTKKSKIKLPPKPDQQ